MEEIKEENKNQSFKCPACGASLKLDEKYCEYCGSVNPHYQQKEPPKDLELPSEEDYDTDMGDMFGGFLGGMMLGGMMRGPAFPFGPRHRGPKPRRRR